MWIWSLSWRIIYSISFQRRLLVGQCLCQPCWFASDKVRPRLVFDSITNTKIVQFVNFFFFRIVEIVSIAIAEFTQAEFLGQQDPQVENTTLIQKRMILCLWRRLKILKRSTIILIRFIHFRGELFPLRTPWPKIGGRRGPGSVLEDSLVQAVRFCPSTSCCGVSGGGGGVVCGGGGLLSTLLHYISFEIWVVKYRI